MPDMEENHISFPLPTPQMVWWVLVATSFFWEQAECLVHAGACQSPS